MSEQVSGEKPGPTTHYTVDGELQTTTLEAMTPREIMEDAGIDPQTHSLTRAGRPPRPLPRPTHPNPRTHAVLLRRQGVGTRGPGQL
jgi:hypothetical protein